MHSPGTSANRREEIRSIWSKGDDSKCNQTLLTIQNKYGPFTHERTIQFNSEVATSRRPHILTRKHPFIIFIDKRGRRIEDQHQVTYRINMYSLEGAKYPAYYRRIISGHHSKSTLQNVVNLRFWCLASIFFLLELRKSIFTLGVQF